MHEGDAGRTVKVVSVPDSADARLFVELSSHAADLSEARRALDLATGEAEYVREYLIGFAVVAYCRTVMLSNVRRRLTEHIEIPAELVDVHEQVRAFRNGTIAHSQSDLAVTYALGVLDAATLDVRDVMAGTVMSSLPRLVVARFQALVEVMQGLLDSAIAPVRARLTGALGHVDPQTLVTHPTVVEPFAHEFTPRTRRRLYPSSHPVYWQAVIDEKPGSH